MSDKNTGGPAFPVEYYDAQLDKRRVMQGMTLRDYFAAKAMQGLMSRKEQGGFDFAVYEKDAMRVSMWAYDLADAMLKAREA
jgi:hypothetical protein